MKNNDVETIAKIEYEVSEVYAVLIDYRKGILMLNNETLHNVISRQIDRLGTALDYIEQLINE